MTPARLALLILTASAAPLCAGCRAHVVATPGHVHGRVVVATPRPVVVKPKPKPRVVVVPPAPKPRVVVVPPAPRATVVVHPHGHRLHVCNKNCKHWKVKVKVKVKPGRGHGRGHR